MKAQIHNLVGREFAPNVGIAYLHRYKTIALGFLFFSITICWAKELKKSQDMGDSQNMEGDDRIEEQI